MSYSPVPGSRTWVVEETNAFIVGHDDLCTFYRNGRCNHGSNCEYIHAHPTGQRPEKTNVCKHFRVASFPFA